MSQLDVRQKLEILADAAKYDASCASSGTVKRDSSRRQGDRFDRRHGHLPRLCARWAMHLAAQDPADQQLHVRLPLLHQSQELERAACALHHAKRWSTSRSHSIGAIISRACSSPRASSGRRTTRWSRSSKWHASLREDHHFRGYIHLKTIPDADPELIHRAGLHADRVSINVELPTEGGLEAARAREIRRSDRRRDGRA
jgi:hypothetical protein